MASYYYLIASLPQLQAGAKPPLDYAAFLEACRAQVSGKVWRTLSELSEHSEKGPLLKDWAAFYRKLRAELCYQRNLKLGRPCVVPAEREPEVIRAVTAAVGAPDPLAGEQCLLELEFHRLDELCSMHPFDDTALLGYAMKLRLLERQRLFQHDAGRAAFDGLLEGLRQQIFRI